MSSRPTCKARGCRLIVEAGMLMCRRHWDMVPFHIQREVYDAHRAYLGKKRTESVHNYGRCVTRYLNAVKAAVEAVGKGVAT